jgi:hypothetical protein
MADDSTTIVGAFLSPQYLTSVLKLTDFKFFDAPAAFMNGPRLRGLAPNATGCARPNRL